MAPHWKCGSGQPVAGSNPALSAIYARRQADQPCVDPVRALAYACMDARARVLPCRLRLAALLPRWRSIRVDATPMRALPASGRSLTPAWSLARVLSGRLRLDASAARWWSARFERYESVGLRADLGPRPWSSFSPATGATRSRRLRPQQEPGDQDHKARDDPAPLAWAERHRFHHDRVTLRVEPPAANPPAFLTLPAGVLR
jgi:hypothetical protein